MVAIDTIYAKGKTVEASNKVLRQWHLKIKTQRSSDDVSCSDKKRHVFMHKNKESEAIVGGSLGVKKKGVREGTLLSPHML